ncbi:CaiB/BaiF CoA transferase family protein [Cupriavidus numazuensis]|uniref:Succinyl-CoA--L-malate CoA-transferase beta subunit n=1 Tax=Cupriavidus numazuensis TaxID=221992 RepID=A0ABM8TSH6_9BURK|nr:CoA transferase [Cupriavidus numazuensis]CAG2159300.1 Succinyl-CoA--L-malate CoA-transferase beta subunit [Cupriavidus numazuensis]
MHHEQAKIDDHAAQVKPGPLSGIRVLDLSGVLLGPVATQILGDYGADVIKIESPEGDVMRGNGVVPRPGMGSIFLAANRNKRSVVLDLKTGEGRAALRKLVETADVFLHNIRIEAIERLGFGYEAVAAIKPDIVYCAAIGYGQDGPHRAKPAFDDIIQGACGLVDLNACGQGPPYMRTAIADKVTGLVLANAVMAALACLARTGTGQYVEVPMLETMAAFVMTEHLGGLTFHGSTEPVGYARLLEGRSPVPTRDGWVCILPYTPEHWRRLLEACGRAELVARYGLATRADQMAHRKALNGHLEEISKQMTTAELLAICESLDIAAGEIFSLESVLDHPHLAAVGLFRDTEHPTEGRIREIRPPVRFSVTPASLRRPAPVLGQHTAEVLAEVGLAIPGGRGNEPGQGRPGE